MGQRHDLRCVGWPVALISASDSIGEAVITNTDLTLISHPLCPFVQRAAIVLLENVVRSSINIDLSPKPDWFLALSPTGKVPLLKVRQAKAEDAVLFESVAIC